MRACICARTCARVSIINMHAYVYRAAERRGEGPPVARPGLGECPGGVGDPRLLGPSCSLRLARRASRPRPAGAGFSAQGCEAFASARANSTRLAHDCAWASARTGVVAERRIVFDAPTVAAPLVVVAIAVPHLLRNFAWLLLLWLLLRLSLLHVVAAAIVAYATVNSTPAEEFALLTLLLLLLHLLL